MLDGDGDLQGLHPVVPDPGTLLTSRVNWDGTKCIIIYCIYIYRYFHCTYQFWGKLESKQFEHSTHHNMERNQGQRQR